MDEVALRLIEFEGVDISATCGSDGTTALWCSCRMRLESVALALLRGGASAASLDVNALSSADGSSALFWACEGGLSAAALALLSVEGITVHAERAGALGVPQEDCVSTAKSTLDAAREQSVAAGGALDPAVVARLVAAGARHSGALLLRAVEVAREESHVAEALRLLDLDGVDVNAKSHTPPFVGWNVLDIARARASANAVPRMDEVVHKLESLGARYGGVALLAALQGADAAAEADILVLFDAPGTIDVSATDACGRTTLFLACRAGLEAVARKLLEVVDGLGSAGEAAIDLNARNAEDGTTVLWCACSMGLEAVALGLLAESVGARGAALGALHSQPFDGPAQSQPRSESHRNLVVDINACSTVDGTTVLWQACEQGMEAVAQRLLDLDVDVDATDAVSGRSSLEIAFERGMSGVVLRLVALKFPERGRDFSAWCALQLRQTPNAATIGTLLSARVNRERVLLAAAILGSIDLANVCVREHEAKGNVRVRGDGRDARTVGMQSARPNVAAFFAKLGTILGRYALDPIPAVHRSRTCIVRLAKDTADGGSVDVALKLMVNRDEFEREIATRELIKYSPIVIGVYGWHTPLGVKVTALDGRRQHTFGQRTVPTEVGSEFPYVLVMERGGQSLFIENVTQRIAGVNVRTVSKLFRSLCERVAALHDLGLVHGDLKLRNVIRRFGEVDVCLCDLDAALPIGSVRFL